MERHREETEGRGRERGERERWCRQRQTGREEIVGG